MFVAEADEAKEACEDPLIKLCHMITVNRNIIGNDMIILPGGIQLHFKGKVHEADPSFIFVWASCQMFFFVDQNCLISVLNHLINHQNTQLNAETKNQTPNRHIFRVLGRLYILILCGSPCILSSSYFILFSFTYL